MFYRYDPRNIPAGRRLDVILERLDILNQHCKTWGVRIIGVRIQPALVEVETDIAIPANKDRVREMGFDATESAA